jgi:transcriptional regulator with GAF, ATPase, and Fis domain
MRRVYKQIDVAAASDLAVLIRGETGTGKELAARAIHRLSQRRSRPFVAVNCAAIPRELAESELFGHEAGAFTGATGRRIGCFATAADGVLLLDEINSLPPELQPKLLRVLEENEFQAVGAAKPQRLAARVLAASNADLAGLAKEGRFRQDLFYRLQVLEVLLPPLRDRPQDIPAIAAAILERPFLGSTEYS